MPQAISASAERPESASSPLIKPYPFTSISPRELPANKPPAQLLAQLREALQDGQRFSSPAEVCGSDDEGFKAAATIFNGAVKTYAFAIVKPRNAQDVSIVVKFCRKHDIELSVKAGGYGVHGWSIAGHIILDMSLLKEISIATPSEATTLQDSFEKLGLNRLASPPAEHQLPASSSKRPSLSSIRNRRSSESTTTSIKRTLADASLSDDEGEPEEKKRMDTIDEGGPSRTSSRESGREDDGDRNMASSSSSFDRSGSSNEGGRENWTPPTSLSGSDSALKQPTLGEGQRPFGHFTTSPAMTPSMPSPSSSSSSGGPSTYNQGRMAYVNPSPTTTTSFPFVSTSFGGGSTSSIPYGSSSFSDGAYGAAPRLILNTNPDPPPYTVVTFGAGVQSKELDKATAASQYGAFHVPTSAFPVGSGQFISGGFGFIGRKHGLAMDNLVEAEMVLADGRIVWVGADCRHGGEWKDDEDPSEVWWGLRGAGAVLGVVTRFRAKGYYLPSVYAGNLIYMFDKATTPSLLRHVRDCIKGSPRTLYTNIIMTAGPPGSPAIVVIQMCFSGPRSEGDMYIQAISSWEGGRCMFQDFSERTFERQQVAVEEVLKGGQGRKWYIKSDMLNGLSDEIVDATCERFHVVPDGCTWLFEYTGGGCISEVKDTCFPTSHRDAAFTVAALHQWSHDEPPVLDTRCVTTAEDWINEVIHPNSPGGPLPCFLQSATLSAVSAVYGENWLRLARLKKRMDPENVFRHAMWPRPGGPDGYRQLDGLAEDLPGVEAENLPDGNDTGRDLHPNNHKGKGRAGLDGFERINSNPHNLSEVGQAAES